MDQEAPFEGTSTASYLVTYYMHILNICKFTLPIFANNSIYRIYL